MDSCERKDNSFKSGLGGGLKCMADLLEVEHLVKRYGTIQAVRDISFKVKQGSLFAFLGTNGAGKSTTIKILSTLMRADGGRVQIGGYTLGKDDTKIRSRIGVVYQNSVLDDLLTVKENLCTRGSFYKMRKGELNSRVMYAAKITGCEKILNQRYGKLSGGQKRRADIARALLQAPDLLFLDEPTTGLDPESRQQIWRAISDMQKKEGLTVFLTTHYMEEASQANDVVIINKGRIVAQGTPDELREQYTKDILRIFHPTRELKQYLRQLNLCYFENETTWEVPVREPEETMRILHYIEDLGITPVFEMKKGIMDDVFLNVVEEAGKSETEGI